MSARGCHFACLASVFLIALAFRLPRLENRPMHADEAVQTVRFRGLWQDGRYLYDPHEFHGPTLAYATLPSAWISGASRYEDADEAMYRLVPALFGAATILVVGLLGSALGRRAAAVAALLLAVSPAMVFYSRYYIHESLMVCFTLLLVACAGRYASSGRAAWALAAGAAAGLVQATKETSVLGFAALIAGVVLAGGWTFLLREQAAPNSPRLRLQHIAWGAAVAAAVAAVLLSSFFTNPRGPWDGVLTYLPWLGRAAGDSPHLHPWDFYLRILLAWRLEGGPWWSEAVIVGLALAGFVAALIPKTWNALPDAHVPVVRWIGFSTLTLTLVYSIIPYKTPWCLLSFLAGMALLAGVGAVAIVRAIPTRFGKCLVSLLIAAGIAHLGWQAHRASFVLESDPRNPYVYVGTQPDALRLERDIAQLVEACPPSDSPRVAVVWHDAYYWPLPWYLRRAAPIGYWSELPADHAAPIVIGSPQVNTDLDQRLGDTHLPTGFYGLRNNVLAVVWVRHDVWEAHLRRLGRL